MLVLPPKPMDPHTMWADAVYPLYVPHPNDLFRLPEIFRAQWILLRLGWSVLPSLPQSPVWTGLQQQRCPIHKPLPLPRQSCIRPAALRDNEWAEAYQPRLGYTGIAKSLVLKASPRLELLSWLRVQLQHSNELPNLAPLRHPGFKI